jgi:pimeloyl-ACP methyl ester carboxylesterase
VPLLYLHGFADVHGAVSGWLPFHEALAASARLLTPAHPGCAASTGSDGIDGVEDLVFHYLDLLDMLGLERVDLVGACVGGWIAAELALRHPHRVGRLLLLGAVGLHVPGAPIADLFMLSQRSDFGKHTDLRRLLFADADLPLALAMFPDRYATLPDEVLRYQCLTFAARIGWNPPYFYDRKLRARLRRVTVPTLVVWGREDRFVSLAHAEAYRAGITGATLKVLDGSGHSIWLEQPEACAKLVTEFLGGS